MKVIMNAGEQVIDKVRHLCLSVSREENLTVEGYVIPTSMYFESPNAKVVILIPKHILVTDNKPEGSLHALFRRARFLTARGYKVFVFDYLFAHTDAGIVECIECIRRSLGVLFDTRMKPESYYASIGRQKREVREYKNENPEWFDPSCMRKYKSCIRFILPETDVCHGDDSFKGLQVTVQRKFYNKNYIYPIFISNELTRQTLNCGNKETWRPGTEWFETDDGRLSQVIRFDYFLGKNNKNTVKIRTASLEYTFRIGYRENPPCISTDIALSDPLAKRLLKHKALDSVMTLLAIETVAGDESMDRIVDKLIVAFATSSANSMVALKKAFSKIVKSKKGSEMLRSEIERHFKKAGITPDGVLTRLAELDLEASKNKAYSVSRDINFRLLDLMGGADGKREGAKEMHELYVDEGNWVDENVLGEGDSVDAGIREDESIGPEEDS